VNTRLAAILLMLVSATALALPGIKLSNGEDAYAYLKRSVDGTGNLILYPDDFSPENGYWAASGLRFMASSPDTCPGFAIKATGMHGTGSRQSPKYIYAENAGDLTGDSYCFSIYTKLDGFFAPDDTTQHFAISVGSVPSNPIGRVKWDFDAGGSASIIYEGSAVVNAGQDSLGGGWWRMWEVVDGAYLMGTGKTKLRPAIFLSSGPRSFIPDVFPEYEFLRGGYIIGARLEVATAPAPVDDVIHYGRQYVAGDMGTTTVPQPPNLGLSYPGNELKYSYSQEAGIGIIRLDAHWRDLQDGTTLAYNDTAGFYGRIETLESMGIEPYITFISDNDELTCTFSDTTCILATTPPETLLLDPTHNDPLNALPLDMTQWYDFVNHVVENLDDTPVTGFSIPNPVKWYSIANEWITAKNTNGGFIGNMWNGLYEGIEDYANSAYSAVKAAYSSANFVMGGGPGTADLGAAVVDSCEATRTYFADYTILAPANPTRVLEAYDLRHNYTSQTAIDAIKAIYKAISFDYLTLHQYGPLAHNKTRYGYWDSVSVADTLNALHPGQPFNFTCDEGGPTDLWADSPLDPQYPDRLTCDDMSCDPGGVTYLALNDTTKFSGVWFDNLDAQAKGMPFFMWFRMFMKYGESSPASKIALCDSLDNRTSGFYAMKHVAALFDSSATVIQYVGQKSAWKITYDDGKEAIIGISVDGEKYISIEPSFAPALTYYIIGPDLGGYEVVPSIDDTDTTRVVVGQLPVVVSQESIMEIK